MGLPPWTPRKDTLQRFSALLLSEGLGVNTAEWDIATDIYFEYMKSDRSAKGLMRAIESRQPLGAQTVLYLMMLSANQEGKAEKSAVSAKASASAASKGKVWRKAAIEQWRERESEFKSMSEFCREIAESPLKTKDGEVATTPTYSTVYDYMRKARKEGALDD